MTTDTTTPTLFDDLPLVIPPGQILEETAPPAPKEFSLIATIIITGEPVPKGRARGRIVFPKKTDVFALFFEQLKSPMQRIEGICDLFKKSFIQFYQESETEKYEQRIKHACRRAIGDADPLDEIPLGLIVKVFRSIPPSWPKKKQAAALRDEVRPLSKPDGDNYLKIACDALNGVMWRDDSIVTDKMVLKRYSDNPRMEIEVFT